MIQAPRATLASYENMLITDKKSFITLFPDCGHEASSRAAGTDRPAALDAFPAAAALRSAAARDWARGRPATAPSISRTHAAAVSTAAASQSFALLQPRSSGSSPVRESPGHASLAHSEGHDPRGDRAPGRRCQNIKYLSCLFKKEKLSVETKRHAHNAALLV